MFTQLPIPFRSVYLPYLALCRCPSTDLWLFSHDLKKKPLLNILSGIIDSVSECKHSESTAKVGSCFLSCSMFENCTLEVFFLISLFYLTGFSDFFEMIISVPIYHEPT